MDLTTNQIDILKHDGDLLLIGGPGTGKTTTGLLKAQKRISEGLEIGQAIIFLSFSNSAVYQIQQAASLTLADKERRALRVQTFHSFCWDFLRSHGCLLGLPPQLAVLAPEEAAAIRPTVSEAEWPERERSLAVQDGRVSFDLFAPLAVEILQRSVRLRRLLGSCYPLIIVDEFQDTDDDQWNLVRALAEHSTLLALGDKDQRIHDFRPRVSSSRLQQLEDIRKPKVFVLSQNHRSPAADHLTFARHVLKPELGPLTRTSVRVRTYKFPTQAGVNLKHLVREAEDSVRAARNSVERPSILVLGTTNGTVRRLSQWLNHRTPKANFQLHHDAFIDGVEMASAWHVMMAFIDSEPDSSEHRGAFSALFPSVADRFKTPTPVQLPASIRREWRFLLVPVSAADSDS